jgi:C4-dicarboxylate transporter, DctQ subunit
LEKAYRAWRGFQNAVLGPAAGLLLLGMTLLALLEVVRRYVFGQSFEWQQDAVTFITLSAVFLYFSTAQRRGAHLTVTLITDTLQALGPGSQRAAAVIRLFATTFAFLFLVAVLWWGLPEVRESIHYESRTESLAFPLWPFLLSLYVGFAFMAVTMFFQLYRDVQKFRGITVLEEPEEPGDAAH